MKVYIDLELVLNFCYDLILLMAVSMVLKRNTKMYRLVLGAVLGAASIILLFLPFPKTLLFFGKIMVSIFMILVAFGYKNIKVFMSNMNYLYMLSVILGGFLYMLDLEFSYKRKGMFFYFEGLSINYLLLLLVGPIVIFLYIWMNKKRAGTYDYMYKVEIGFGSGKVLIINGFLDTGNKLKDPVSHKYIIIVSKKKLNGYINIRSPMYVPYKALNKTGVLECYKIDYLKINNKVFKNYLVGASKGEFNLDNIDCLLNYKLLEDICLEK